MDNPTVIVTGASRGLGAAIAEEVTRLGGRVVLNARSADQLAGVAQRLRDAGGEALVVPGDVSDPDVCERMIEKSRERFGHVDALINNAAVITPIGPVAETDPASWRASIEINVVAPFLLAHFALPALRERNGTIINVSSGAATSPIAGWSAYCASKAALNLFSGVLAAEEPEITVLAVRPGVVATSMQEEIRQEGATGMRDADHARFIRYHEQEELLPPGLPGRAIAVLALQAPLGWSGQFLSWDEPRVKELVAAIAR